MGGDRDYWCASVRAAACSRALSSGARCEKDGSGAGSKPRAGAAMARLIPHKRGFEQFRSMDLFQATNVTFEQTNTQKFIGNTKITLPKADMNLLAKYLEFAVRG